MYCNRQFDAYKYYVGTTAYSDPGCSMINGKIQKSVCGVKHYPQQRGPSQCLQCRIKQYGVISSRRIAIKKIASNVLNSIIPHELLGIINSYIN